MKYKIAPTQYNSHLSQGVILKIKLLFAVGITLSLSAFAQTSIQTDTVPQTTMIAEPANPAPMLRTNVISRTVQAVNYQHRSGATKIDFAGTDLMPSANGHAKVESKRGSIEIEVDFGNLHKTYYLRQ